MPDFTLNNPNPRLICSSVRILDTMKLPTAPAQSVPSTEKGAMASRTVWQFAYGSNMNRAQMLSRTGKILEEHNASLPNYEVRFNKKVRGGTAGANVQPSSGKTVHGV